MNRTETAVSLFKQGYSCSQAVLAAFAEEFGMNRATALRVAGGFGGGIGRTAQTCGAVTGAVMVLGLKFASVDAADRAAKEATYAKVREFLKRFQERHGATTCKDLLGCDIGTPEGSKSAREANLFKTQCPLFVESAAAIVEAMLELDQS